MHDVYPFGSISTTPTSLPLPFRILSRLLRSLAHPSSEVSGPGPPEPFPRSSAPSPVSSTSTLQLLSRPPRGRCHRQKKHFVFHPPCPSSYLDTGHPSEPLPPRPLTTPPLSSTSRPYGRCPAGHFRPLALAGRKRRLLYVRGWVSLSTRVNPV